MERRVLGKTNHRSFIVTLGGSVFIYPVEQEKGDAFVKYALDSSVNHIDVARARGGVMHRKPKNHPPHERKPKITPLRSDSALKRAPK